DDASRIAVDRDRLREAGVNARRRLDDAEGAAFELEAGDRGILDLDTLMGEHGGEAAQSLDGTHRPEKQIDVVDRLGHPRAAAVECLGPLPPALVVVLLRAPPFAGRLAESEPAKAAGVNGLLQFNVRVAEARGKDRAKLHAGAIAGLDDPVAALRRDFERL